MKKRYKRIVKKTYALVYQKDVAFLFEVSIHSYNIARERVLLCKGSYKEVIKVAEKKINNCGQFLTAYYDDDGDIKANNWNLGIGNLFVKDRVCIATKKYQIEGIPYKDIAAKIQIKEYNTRVQSYKIYKNYQDYLKSDEWKYKREKSLERAQYACQVCNGDNGLNVHHRTYSDIGKEKLQDLTVLCKECHTIFHTYGRIKNKP